MAIGMLIKRQFVHYIVEMFSIITYMLEENDDTISLITDRNLGDNILWISKTNDTAAAGDVHSYHTSTANGTLSYIFEQVAYNGLISGQYPATDYLVGIKPVITINKSHISK